ncbi:MAG: DUF5689 domain-containing protein [Pedobacter sp.]|nr:DUF5689 domain-containing protein [Pedobacter sp.]MDQ8052059.1 DUF5689 domain-containing protein [Pedobacter sp.]
MKKIIYSALILLSVAFMWSGCKDNDFLNGFGNYEGGQISTSIPIFDVRQLYKGTDVTLDKDRMFGGIGISGVIISDYTENNFTDDLKGLVFIQDNKRLNSLRGIAINLGADANKWVSGDSVFVNLEGAVLTKANGRLQLNNVSNSNITKKMSNKPIATNGVLAANILLDPTRYESTLVSIVEGTYNPLLAPGTTLSGEKTLNDGSDNVALKVLPTAAFANLAAPFSANYTGVLVNTLNTTTGKLVSHVRPRMTTDVEELSATSSVPDFVITGWNNDPAGTDSNNEYVQFRATRDINFAVTPFSVVTTNNATASTPLGYPTTGWALGGIRTYKFNLTTGSVKKGDFFYVGGSKKLINSTSSTSIASANWIRSFDISTTGGDGFGTATANLLANSGNAYGVAVFKGTTVNVSSVPIDVLFVATGGTLYQASPALGYNIGKTDWYNPVNPLEKKNPAKFSQPFYRQGTNTKAFAYWPTSDAGMWNQFGGGVFDTVLGKWTKARTQTFILLSKTSTLAEIEGADATQIK